MGTTYLDYLISSKSFNWDYESKNGIWKTNFSGYRLSLTELKAVSEAISFNSTVKNLLISFRYLQKNHELSFKDVDYLFSGILMNESLESLTIECLEDQYISKNTAESIARLAEKKLGFLSFTSKFSLFILLL